CAAAAAVRADVTAALLPDISRPDVILRLQSRWLRAAAPMLLLVLSAGAEPVGLAQPQPAYVTRGDEVDAASRRFDARLQEFFDKLSAAVRSHAPGLSSRLAAPKPSVYGYGLLPKLLPPAARSPRAAIQSARY